MPLAGKSGRIQHHKLTIGGYNLKKLVVGTLVVGTTAYAVYFALLLAATAMPGLPAPPRLPFGNPEVLFDMLGKAPGEVGRRMAELNDRVEKERKRAEDRLRQQAEAAEEAAREVGRKGEELQRKEREIREKADPRTWKL